mmetsp:Transcript_96101/g.276766  ORF Transcript_96101/g.276766 Transcript_96101/m.276766 type:complete len:233 (-) Transcript_96101:136-834(-)
MHRVDLRGAAGVCAGKRSLPLQAPAAAVDAAPPARAPGKRLLEKYSADHPSDRGEGCIGQVGQQVWASVEDGASENSRGEARRVHQLPAEHGADEQAEREGHAQGPECLGLVGLVGELAEASAGHADVAAKETVEGAGGEDHGQGLPEAEHDGRDHGAPEADEERRLPPEAVGERAPQRGAEDLAHRIQADQDPDDMPDLRVLLLQAHEVGHHLVDIRRQQGHIYAINQVDR